MFATGVIHVLIAADAAKGETNMSELINETAEAAATAPETAKRKAPRARKPRVGKSEGKASKKATPAKQAPKSATKATSKPKAAKPGKPAKQKGMREGSKTETILALLKRSGGATLQEIMKATAWQAHSVRGFISGTLGKKMGLTVASTKSEDGERSYSIKA
jgi:hypothetical protein